MKASIYPLHISWSYGVTNQQLHSHKKRKRGYAVDEFVSFLAKQHIEELYFFLSQGHMQNPKNCFRSQ